MPFDVVALEVAPSALQADARTRRGVIGLANPARQADALTVAGTLQVTKGGDFAADSSAEASLRKRIQRRVLLGGFFHLTGYGAALQAETKRLLRPSDRRRQEEAIRRQVMQEPDVRSVRVGIAVQAGVQLVQVTAWPTWNDGKPVVESVQVP